jgi:hypothetical protein
VINSTLEQSVVVRENGSKVVTRRLGGAGQAERVGHLESGGEGETFCQVGSGSVEEEVSEVGFYVVFKG